MFWSHLQPDPQAVEPLIEFGHPAVGGSDHGGMRGVATIQVCHIPQVLEQPLVSAQGRLVSLFLGFHPKLPCVLGYGADSSKPSDLG